MIQRVAGCWGLTLWNWGRRIELWFCFSEVPPHRHPGQRVEVMPLFGWGRFCRMDEEIAEWIEVRPARWGRWFTVPAGWVHWFTVWHRPMIFLNKTYNGQSAAKNFVPI